MSIQKRTGNEIPRPTLGKTHRSNRWVRFVDLNDYTDKIVDFSNSTFLPAPQNPQDGDTLVYNSTTNLWEAGASGGNGLNIEVATIPHSGGDTRFLPAMEDVNITVNRNFYDLTPKEGKEIVLCLSTVMKGTDPSGINNATTRTVFSNIPSDPTGVLKIEASVLGVTETNLTTTNEIVIEEGHIVFLYVVTKDREEKETKEVGEAEVGEAEEGEITHVSII